MRDYQTSIGGGAAEDVSCIDRDEDRQALTAARVF